MRGLVVGARFILRGLFVFCSERVRNGVPPGKGVFCFTRVIRFLERARAERGPPSKGCFVLRGLFAFCSERVRNGVPPSKGCFVLRGLFAFCSGRGRNGGYFPTQKRLKIEPRMSSGVTSPVTEPSASRESSRSCTTASSA